MNTEKASECGRAIDHISNDILVNAEILKSVNLTVTCREGIDAWIASQIEARKAISKNLNEYTSSIE